MTGKVREREKGKKDGENVSDMQIFIIPSQPLHHVISSEKKIYLVMNIVN